ncbi:hypothetical protein I3843_12G014800 [Carya illinoinensis]|uniref:PGG domain-containing protein n=1 Tax=Carya illinoinensis TaxID=32201 RepID=A0A8T1NU66_CARIL|nr:uncharacterized protein LOC122288925 isoform X1 [Carya illinoinensis]XP_042951687.1 uncharacterized protein LOC122288925 isoform X1 [Carya illinoinensis]XP_042951688.1 uncharacterized protein LOC122288925 isoform X1 [Carya illinoinensis]KAG6632952.1 hypothetical protein CIPAW_12G014800 [Carya illinoinensis]KAG7951578.1 hypothetical protein I3843_12G014800 [Carya illinoinensis]KAG7951579.1 hypothetical protein I3843_12G014800 [Carya illinoinensis]
MDNALVDKLKKNVRTGNWDATRDILNSHPDVLTARITLTGGTILHVAVAAQKENIVQKLVDMMSEHDLAIQDDKGYTALHETTFRDNSRMAEYLISKNNSLIGIRTFSKDLPVVMAMRCGHKQLASYLYFLTPLDELEVEQGHQGSVLLTYAIYARHVDIAKDLMGHYPSLAFAVHQENLSPLNALATFQRTENQLTIREITINSLVLQYIPILALWQRSALRSLSRIVRADYHQPGRPGYRSLIISILFTRLIRPLAEALERLLRRELENNLFQELLSHICTKIPTFTQSQVDSTIAPAIFCAISRGNYEFVSCMLEANPEFLWIRNSEGMNIFHCAVLHRQAKICSLIYELEGVEALIAERDQSGNTILHLAGMLTENTPIDQIAGAALQMRREVKWFKEVESICQPISKELLNSEGLSPKQVFRMTHQNLRERGEQWMKETTTSGLVAATLIVTIMFTAAFTIPGGNDDKGLPILVNDTQFKIFMVTVSLSLFSSSTSVLMFLGIFTSRYAEEDFRISLPQKMMIGFFTLFFSIGTMLVGFCLALTLLLQGQLSILIPIFLLAVFPLQIFWLTFIPLLDNIVSSSIQLSIFDKKMKFLI